VATSILGAGVVAVDAGVVEEKGAFVSMKVSEVLFVEESAVALVLAVVSGLELVPGRREDEDVAGDGVAGEDGAIVAALVVVDTDLEVDDA